MKKFAFILILLFSLHFVQAQSWQVIYPNEQYHYFTSNQTDSLIRNTLFVNSILFNGSDTVYKMNKHFEPKGPDPFYPFYSLGLINQTSFLKNNVAFLPNGLQQLQDTSNFYVNSYCNIGDSWVYDSTANMVAVCDSIYLTSILGLTDSVKRILVNTYDTIILSKNYGIIRYPIYDTAHNYYYLVGLKNQNVGLSIGTINDFLNFNIGDEFEYLDSYYNAQQHTTSSYTDYYSFYYRYRISSKLIANDTLYYGIRKSYYVTGGSNHNWPPTYSYIDTLVFDTLKYPLSLDVTLSSVCNEYSLSNNLTYCKFENLDYNWGFSKVYETKHINMPVISDSVRYSDQYGSITNILKTIYHTVVGLTYKEITNRFSFYTFDVTKSTLLACKINGIQYGTFLNDTTYFPCSKSAINNNVITTTKDTILIGIDSSTTLFSSLKNYNYLWSTGATTDSIIVSQAGNYTLTISTSAGCEHISTISVYRMKAVDANSIIASSLLFCRGGSITLSSKLSGYKYLWSNGSTQNSIIVFTPKTYYLTTTDSAGNQGYTSISVSNYNDAPVYLGNDTVLKANAYLYLTKPLGFSNYIWSDGSTAITYIVSADDLPFGETKIWVRAWNSNCVYADTISIWVYPKAATLEENWSHYFSINDNEINFFGAPYGYHLQIYSIEGKLMSNLFLENEKSNLSIDIAAWTTGIYFMRITDAQGSLSRKFYVRHHK